MHTSLKGIAKTKIRQMPFSKSEKAIAYYLHQLFTDTQENVKLAELGGLELDIYIPSLRLGIEYDGLLYHKDVSRDMYKDLICQNNSISIIRFREKGLPHYRGPYLELIETKGLASVDNFTEDIKWCFNVICQKFNIQQSVDINVRRDLSKIKSKYTQEKINLLGMKGGIE